MMSRRVLLLVTVVVFVLLLATIQAYAARTCSSCGQKIYTSSWTTTTPCSTCGEAPCSTCGQAVHKLSCPSCKVRASSCDVCGQKIHKASYTMAAAPCSSCGASPCSKCGQTVHKTVCAMKTSCDACGNPRVSYTRTTVEVPCTAQPLAVCPYGLNVMEPTALGDQPTCGFDTSRTDKALFDEIRCDHKAVWRALDQFKCECPTAEAWGQLAAMISANNKAEDAAIYNILALNCKGQDAAAKRMAQHAAIQAQIDALNGIPVADCKWLPTFMNLRRDVRDHYRSEERNSFPLAWRIIQETPFCSVHAAYSGQRDTVMTGMGMSVPNSNAPSMNAPSSNY